MRDVRSAGLFLSDGDGGGVAPSFASSSLRSNRSCDHHVTD